MEGQIAKSWPIQGNGGDRGSHTTISLFDPVFTNSTPLTWYSAVDYKGGKELEKQAQL